MSGSVAVVTTVHHPDDPRIRVKTIGSLADAGWRVRYLCSRPGPSETDGIEVVPLEGGRLARLARAARLMWTARVDVIVVHDPELLLAALPIGIVRGRHRVVFDLHENLPKQLASRPSTPPVLRGVTAWMARFMLRLAERFVTVTLAEPGYGELFRGDHPVFENHPMPAMLPRRAEDAAGVVYVGDITRARGATVLVEAVGRLDGVTLTLIGRCDDDLRQELEMAARAAGLAIEFTGFLPYGRAWARAATCLVGVSPLNDLPNYRESLPTKILEYRAVGLVTVVSDLPASVAATQGSVATRTFRAGDADDLAMVLRDVLADPTIGEVALAEAASVRAAGTWDDEGYVSFFEGLIAGR